MAIKDDAMNIKDPLIIIGNGPSFKYVDLGLIRAHDTYGLNGAYKLYPELNFYPKYWSAFDSQWIETGGRYNDINKMLVDPKCLINHIILLEPPETRKYVNSEKLLLIKDSCDSNDIFFYYNHDMCPAIFSVTKIAICLGYKKLIYVGVDCNYNHENYNQYFDSRIVGDENLWDIKNQPKLISDHNSLCNENIKSLNEYCNQINKIHEGSFKILRDYYTNIDFVNCSGESSNLQALRRGKLEQEIL